MTDLRKWLREAAAHDSIDTLIQRCNVAASEIDRLNTVIKDMQMERIELIRNIDDLMSRKPSSLKKIFKYVRDKTWKEN